MNIALNMQNKRLKNPKHCIQIKCFLLQSSQIANLENIFNLKIIPANVAIKTCKYVKLCHFLSHHSFIIIFGSEPPWICLTSLKCKDTTWRKDFSFTFSQYKMYSWSSTLSRCQPHLIQERLASSKCCQDFHCLPNMSLFY